MLLEDTKKYLEYCKLHDLRPQDYNNLKAYFEELGYNTHTLEKFKVYYF